MKKSIIFAIIIVLFCIAIVGCGAEATGDAYALILDNSNDSENSTPMVFVRSEEEINVGDSYDSDTYGSLAVIAVYAGFEDEIYASYEERGLDVLDQLSVGSEEWALVATDIPWYTDWSAKVTSVIAEDKIAPKSVAFWFKDFANCTDIDLRKVDTSNITDMSHTFDGVNTTEKELKIDVTGWDTSAVTSMYMMFSSAGSKSNSVEIKGLNGFDTSSVTTMHFMFRTVAYSAETFNIGDISKWDVSKVVDFSCMFDAFGSTSEKFSIGDLSKWNTSSAKNMFAMFQYAGMTASHYDDSFKMDLSGWNIDNVISKDSFNNLVDDRIIAPEWVE